MGHKTLICAGIFIMHLMTTTRIALLSAGSSITVHQQYHFINKSLTWYEAQSFCRLKYTDLATINDMDDENQLINTLGGNVTSSWIGLYDGQINRWLWSDGSGIASFTQWSPGEPNNAGGIESCGEMYDSLWNDAPCGFVMAYVCYEIQQDGSKKYVVYTQGQTWPNSQDLWNKDLLQVLEKRRKL
ncbi:C-type lectin domain family 4 member K-like [Astatotilapia calliptera]|uniref:C-type lectin domain family 4 member K-like n=1 Tax=Astatotilapia calliptera TaxID=8154 RepID=UPI000E3FD258|nr:C-type lectin domain family 4 member K-like [Astatotilapia calliptera]